MRRIEGDIEVRLVECLGSQGMANLTLSLPHTSARITDMNGANPKALPKGTKYTFPVRPQQIVTLRFGTTTAVKETEVVTKWDAMVPPEKLPMLYRYSGEKGHPPKGS
jgi:hypothetical protein